MFVNFYLKTFLFIAVASIAAYFLHHVIIDDTAIAPWRIYTFLGTATLLTVTSLRFVHHYVPDKLGYGFLGLIFIKCGAAIVLFPELIADDPGLSKAELLQFLTPYALFLFMEVAIVIKWLNDN